MKLALVGYGYWGSNLMRCFSAAQGCDVCVVCEPERGRHADIWAKYPKVESIDESFDQTVSRSDIDAVVLSTPAEVHYEQAKRALAEGKHVFVEKPLALTSSEARELAESADQKTLKLMVGHTFLYNDAVRWVKKAIDDGSLGTIHYIYFQRLALGRVRRDVDAAWNLAPHDISIALYWFDEVPKKVSSSGMDFLQSGIDDLTFISLSFDSQRFAHIHVSWLDPLKTRRAVIVGSKKMVVYDDVSSDQKITVFDKGFDRETTPAGEMGSVPFSSFDEFMLIHRAGDIVIPKIKFREPLQQEAQHFVDCVLNDRRPRSDGLNGYRVVSILEAAGRARRKGKTLRMDWGYQ